MALASLIRLAERNNGRIPAEIPAHYVKWAQDQHRASRSRVNTGGIETHPPRPSRIILPF